MNGFCMYWKMVAVSVRAQWQYRASFMMLALGNALSSLIDFLGIWAFFGRFGALGSWTLAEVGVFFGMGNIAFSICEAWTRHFDRFSVYVRSGDFDRILLRPRSTVLQMLGAELQILRIGRLAQGVGVLIFSLSALDLRWDTSHWILLIASILGGALLFSSLIVLQATSCFWTVESLEIWNSITYGGVQTAQYPLDIYRKPLKWFFTYIVPLAAMSYFPCSVLLGRGYVPAIVSWLSPLVGVAAFFASLLVWRFGVRHYRSTGS